jgi:hypothetical protein
MRILDMMQTAIAPYQNAESKTESPYPSFPEQLDAALWSQENLPDPEQVLADAVDVGAKTVIVAPSKARKSFFLLQLSLCIAAGRPTFLSWNIPRPRNVLLIQLEITPVHFQKRLCRMMHGLNIAPEEITNRLHILNGRGANISLSTQNRIVEIARELEAGVIVIDPIYKLIEGDENKAEDVKPLLLMFDRLATAAGAAVIYAHHTGKGVAGDRQAIDRAVGSGVLARDFDTQISLVPHQTDGLLVCEQIARSYPPKPPTTLRWENDQGCFTVSDDRPVIGTSNNRNRSGFNGLPILDDELIALFKGYPLPGDVYLDKLAKQGMSVRSARATRQRLLHERKIASFRENKFQPITYYGTPEMIEKMRQDYMNPKLPLPQTLQG